MELKSRFESFFTKKPGCWLWQGYKDKNGYGNFRIRQNKMAHRISYQLYRGEIPPRIFVCHTCDIPSCVNPDHLFLGTPKDNTFDMISKGRAKLFKKGLDNPYGKFTPQDKLNIQRRYIELKSYRKVAKEFKCAHNAIRAIILQRGI